MKCINVECHNGMYVSLTDLPNGDIEVISGRVTVGGNGRMPRNQHKDEKILTIPKHRRDLIADYLRVQP